MARYFALWGALEKSFSVYYPRKYPANSTILFQGEIPPLALVLRSGFVVSYTINNNGDEQIVALFSSGDLIPVEWIFDRSPVSLYYYRALTNCELVALNKSELEIKIKQNTALANDLLEHFASSFIASTVHIHALEHSLSKEKVIKLLHYLVLRFGVVEKRHTNIYTIPFKLTHSQIASMVGITRESVTNETIKLKKLSAIKYSQGVYTVNLPVLLNYLGNEEFDKLKI